MELTPGAQHLTEASLNHCKGKGTDEQLDYTVSTGYDYLLQFWRKFY